MNNARERIIEYRKSNRNRSARSYYNELMNRTENRKVKLWMENLFSYVQLMRRNEEDETFHFCGTTAINRHKKFSPQEEKA